MVESLRPPNDTFERVKVLADYNLDYSALQTDLNDLVQIAKIAVNVPMAFINIIDADNAWIVSSFSFGTGCLGKEETVCQYTVAENRELEIKDLTFDERVKHLGAIRQLELKYYYGIPIQTESGHCLGTLCVVDTTTRDLTEDQLDTLRLLVKEVTKRLEHFRELKICKSQIHLLNNERRILAHDIRGPVGGIMGLARFVCERDWQVPQEEILEYLKLIKESAQSVLELAGDILSEGSPNLFVSEQTTLLQLKEKITQLFMPRIKDKQINFSIELSEATAPVLFSKNKIQQIIGNLLSNAIKFTPAGGFIRIVLNLGVSKTSKDLEISIYDNGIGMDEATVKAITDNNPKSTNGTNGEVGYGLGLQLIKQLVNDACGRFQVSSSPLKGSTFRVDMPVTQ